MPPFSPDLFTRLINHRVSDERARREDYLTECVAWVLSNDPDFLAEFLGPDGPLFAGRDHLAPPAGIALEVETQVQVSASDRPDLRIKADGFVLLVENKVDAPFDRGQVERYLSHVAAVPLGGVAAVVPRRSMPTGEGTPKSDRFLGVVAWEDVAALVSRLGAAGDARDGFRAALVALLDSYGLVPFDGEVAAWERPDGTQDVEQVRRICRVFDAAATEVGADRVFLDAAPDPYRAGVVTAYAATAGSGPSPRPVLQHFTALRSFLEPASRYRYYGFLDAVLAVNFQSAMSDADTPGPVVEFFVETRPVPRVGGSVKWIHDEADLVRALLAAGGWDATLPAEPRWPSEAVRDLRQGYAAVIRGVAARLRDQFPGMREEPYGEWGARLVLWPTRDYVLAGVDLEALRTRHAQLLRSVFGALFEADPAVPLGLLLTRALCARS